MPVTVSLYQNVCNLPDSNYEEEDTLKIDDPDISDSNKSEILSYSVWNYWGERILKTSTGFPIPVCMMCYYTHYQ